VIVIGDPFEFADCVLTKYEFLKNMASCAGTGAGISGTVSDGETDALPL
jgi:hypothetical protein